MLSFYFGRTVGQNYVGSTIQAPLLFHMAPHLFVGAGPYVTVIRYLASGTQAAATAPTSYGLTGLLGGWF
jgi:hypothetical protein